MRAHPRQSTLRRGLRTGRFEFCLVVLAGCCQRAQARGPTIHDKTFDVAADAREECAALSTGAIVSPREITENTTPAQTVSGQFVNLLFVSVIVAWLLLIVLCLCAMESTRGGGGAGGGGDKHAPFCLMFPCLCFY